MKRGIEQYNFPKEIVETVRPIIEAFEQNDIAGGEERVAKLAIDICRQVEKGVLSPRKGDRYFLLIDLYLGDHLPELKLRSEVKDILHEGNILHDYGKDYGADLTRMKSLAENLLRNK